MFHPTRLIFWVRSLIKDAGTDVEVKVYEGEGHIFNKGGTLSDIERRRYEWFERYIVKR